MEFRDFTTGKDDDGRRLDRVLRIFLSEKSLGEIYKLIRKGLIKVNQKKTKPDAHVNQGDIISIAEFLFAENLEEKNTTTAVKQKAPVNLKIVFENQHLLIIDKPYGRSVHGSQNNNDISLDKEVLSYWEAQNKDSREQSLSFRPGPLHRLDRNTTGLLVFSKSLEGAKWFSESIKNHTVQKKYLGISEGNLKEVENWEDKLADAEEDESVFSALAKNDKHFHTVSQNDSGKIAITQAKPLAHGKLNGQTITLTEFAIKTGRKHQIRAQSQLHGHSLAGDKAYGGKKDKELKREYYLHAYSLSFPPDNPLNLPKEIKTELPDDFKALLQYCEIKNHGL